VSQDSCAPSAPVIGLVGGIGSGKSALARWVAQHAHIEILDADQLGHQALDDTTLAKLVLDRFPQAANPDYTKDTTHSNQPNQPIRRAALAEIVFGANPESQSARNDLETIVHPYIRRRLTDLIQQHREQDGCEGILVDAAVLLEAGWDDLCDYVVFVNVPEATRLARIDSTRDWTHNQYLDRQASQWPLTRKQDASDSSIDNNRTLEHSGQQLLELIHSLDNPDDSHQNHPSS
jgi:dephospho-CoA kinase